ncbi:MAG: CDP-glycerol glycerophosphotransferase family protein [Clostridium sp.]|nr:CDP-glycerol glycerophosphotransferase family protein [Clostridium sp.]
MAQTYFKAIKKNSKRFMKSGFFRAKFFYTKYYEKLPIIKNTVLIQSYDGSSISCNPYYILKELCENKKYTYLKKYVVVRESTAEVIKQRIESNGWSNVEYVEIHSKEYCRILATAQYLINNSTYPTYFIKRDGQIYLNTWHGTPLKTLGRSIKNAPNELGNTQRNFMMADYLLYPNRFTFEVMKKDYMLNNLFKGKYILSGYPRNEAFYNSELRKKIRAEYGLENKRVVVFMPTWKGSLEAKNTEEQITYTKHAIYEMEEYLDEDIVVFVKLHNYVSEGLDFRKLEKIKSMPADYETYEFLNIADCLITDYSSVFFDFANTNKKIILYAYDLEKYLRERGMYLDFKSLPLSLTYNSRELVDEINSTDKFEPYADGMHPFVEFDSADASKILCDYIFDGKMGDKLEVINGTDYANNKENVLLFSGSLHKNGITTAFKNLINGLEGREDKNYIITFYKSKVNPNRETIMEFEHNDYISMQGPKNFTISEAFCQFLYKKCNIKTKHIVNVEERLNRREAKRLFPNLKVDYVINFSGYEANFFNLQSAMDCKTYVWAHNNMYKEEKLKHNFHIDSLKTAYETSDKIVVVRDTMKQELAQYVNKGGSEKICVVHNLNDVDGIHRKANREIEFQGNTYCNVTKDKLNAVLEKSDCNKFINIARFSKEKGIDRLITAFDKYRNECDQNAWLIIIGGYGVEFKNILSMVQDENGNVLIPNIIIIKSIMNPYPILKKCSAFVLSSLYEGLPMTIIEALILNVPVISTDITGPREFLSAGYGHLVDDSEQGILQGLKDYKNTGLKNLTKFDVDAFNKNAIEEFDSLFE